jgi:ribosome-associated protein
MAEPEVLAVGDRPINLSQVLKLVGWASTGGEAKTWVAEGLVRVNGEVELRKRRQMQKGDVVQVDIDGAPGPIVLG